MGILDRNAPQQLAGKTAGMKISMFRNWQQRLHIPRVLLYCQAIKNKKIFCAASNPAVAKPQLLSYNLPGRA